MFRCAAMFAVLANAEDLRSAEQYQQQQLVGWTVHVSERLLREHEPATKQALGLLEKQLDEIVQRVPAAAVAHLKQVPLWFSPEYPNFSARAEYHPGADWLRENGRDPAMVKAVEFTNILIFEEECRRMPNFALHELAHAYHDRVLDRGFQNPDVQQAFERARASGSYERVLQRMADGRTTVGRSYALTDPMEYFAESTEAYFSTNDFFPFTREELDSHDPAMSKLLGRLWAVPVPAANERGSRDWPQFRGPNSNAHAAGPATPLVWSESQNVDWRVKIPGLGWSSPAISDGKVVVTTAIENDKRVSLRALALDAQTGRTLWDTEVQSVDQTPSIHQKNSHASPTPIVHEAAAFVHFGTLGTAKLDVGSGAIVWKSTELEYAPVHGSGGSPVLHDGRLIVVCDGSKNPYVAALDAATGNVLWKTPRSVPARISHSFVTPLVAVVDGRPQIMAPGPDHFAAYDFETGAEIWQVRAPGWSVVPQPTVTHGLVIYNHDFDNPELMAVKLGGQGDVTQSHVAWRLKRGAPSTPTPLVVGDELYCVSDNGIASCIDVASGQVHWSKRLGGNYSASPVFANGHILFLSEDGVATWVEVGRDFEILGTNEVPGRTFATPAFAAGAMYLRTDEYLYKISFSGSQTGTE